MKNLENVNVSPSTTGGERPAATPVNAASPWLGLASFTEETRAFFHGRDGEVAELSRRVQRKLLTVLFGQSGLGKTSILRAGVVPRLRAEGCCPVYVRLDYGRESPEPAEQIKEAVVRATAEAGTWARPGVAEAGESLWEFLHHRDDTLHDAAGRPLTPLLIFDQFEEIFTLAQGDDFGRRRAAQFMEDLADLVENRAPQALEARLERDEAAAERFDFGRADYRILISLREDYLAHFEGLKIRMPSATQNRMRLARMTGEQALSAVTGPGGALVSEDVARAIVRFVAGGADLERAEVEPSLLSLVCSELNHARQARGDATISADLLAGSRDTILSEFYERALADQPAGVRVFIEDELLTDSGYRESIAEERVKKGFAAAGAPAGSLAALVERRLLRIEERLDVRRVELTHDVLCGVVKTSRDVRQERDAREAEARRRVETEAALADARADEAAARRAAMRARFVAAVCTVLAFAAIGAAIWGWVNLRRAEAAETRVARERDRAQQSRAEAEKLVTFLLDDLHMQLEPTGRIEIVSGLARRALSYFEALPAEVRDARSERYRALALGRLGSALSQLGKTLEAERPLQEAEQLFLQLRAAGERSPETTLGLAAVLRHQARNAYLQNRNRLSVELAQRSVATIEEAARAPGAPAAARLEHGRTLLGLGFNLMRDRQPQQALEALARARAVLRPLADEPGEAMRAAVAYTEVCAWTEEAARLVGREDEVAPLVDEALSMAEGLVAREAGNLGALRSQLLILNRKTQQALDRYDYAAAERFSRQQAAGWGEFLRFDPANDTARNNRRVALAMTSQALLGQGDLDRAIETAKATLREEASASGSPSSFRGNAAGSTWVIFFEAELGRVTNPEAALAESEQLRKRSAAQVDPESYDRFAVPIWGDLRRAEVLFRMGRASEAAKLGETVRRATRDLRPDSQASAANLRELEQAGGRLRIQAALTLKDWPAAARFASELLAGRPAPNESGRAAVEALANDRVLAGLSLARNGESAEAQRLLQLGGDVIRAIRRSGGNDHQRRYQTALLDLGEGLLAGTPEAKRAAFSAGLAEIEAMPPQPRQLRSVRELGEILAAELSKTANGRE